MSKNISVVIITNDHDIVLRETLPAVLSQQYDAEFEVIVVRETRKGGIKDILEQFYPQYRNLHSTYLPDQPQYVTNEEIEILLGVKAARYENVIVIPPSFSPGSGEWLQQTGILLETEPLTSGRPVLLGDIHTRGLGFLKRFQHRRNVKKSLKKWCKANGAKPKTLYPDKESAGLFSIAFLNHSYIEDMPLRNIIYKQLYI
ncbi:MAG: hypothetical protein NC344_06730 [Bacteroidales bacterium]|nr:hypothetical protein [Bacteroidales bacterium]MCM1147511.1 hypothetical protein [Bacteroidales bacterium]MCM1206180.1 hypothetical protein [Bacillota bacterium]MCM1509986.1 hypothetical protein [Clostridium sp.]